MSNWRGMLGRFWTDANWQLVEVLTNPAKVTLLFMALLVLLWGLPLLMPVSKNWIKQRKFLNRMLILVLVLYWLTISPLGAAALTYPLTTALPADLGQPADAIVVLTRNRRDEGRRYETAIDLYLQGRSPRIFVTTEGNLEDAANLLQARGLPLSILSATNCARTTKDEAETAATILGPQGVETIILITDPAHLRRATLTFEGYGFAVIPHAETAPIPDARRSLLALREYPALVSYLLLGRFRPESPNALRNPAPEQLEKVEARECAIAPSAS
ncbi:MAG: YdcF family protein [Cyanobacteria bacterium J069]|nr:MAG: YdcF family protein [Cyanobacteria bacterium J069]